MAKAHQCVYTRECVYVRLNDGWDLGGPPLLHLKVIPNHTGPLNEQRIKVVLKRAYNTRPLN